jgi:hypothetical protein
VLLPREPAELRPLALVPRNTDPPQKATTPRVLAVRVPRLRTAAVRRSRLRKVLRNAVPVLEAPAVVAAPLGKAPLGRKPKHFNRFVNVARNAFPKRKAVPVIVLTLRRITRGGDLVIVIRTGRIERDPLPGVVAEADVAHGRRIALASRKLQKTEAFVHVTREFAAVKKHQPENALRFGITVPSAREESLYGDAHKNSGFL